MNKRLKGRMPTSWHTSVMYCNLTRLKLAVCSSGWLSFEKTSDIFWKLQTKCIPRAPPFPLCPLLSPIRSLAPLCWCFSSEPLDPLPFPSPSSASRCPLPIPPQLNVSSRRVCSCIPAWRLCLSYNAFVCHIFLKNAIILYYEILYLTIKCRNM